MLPALVGEHYFANRPKGISLQKLLFGSCPTPLATTKSPLKAKKNNGKTCRFSTFSLSGLNIFTFRAHLVRVCIKVAYLSKCIPHSSRKHILANRCIIMFNKNLTFRIECASECLLAASGLHSR